MAKIDVFVLGGEDAEMAVIRALLQMQGMRYVQPRTEWGNHSYSPTDVGLEEKEVPHPMSSSLGGGTMKVHTFTDGSRCERVAFVECNPGEGWLDRGMLTVVDHHGELSSRPASIFQVYDLIGRPQLSSATLRWVELIAANDSGFIPAMLAIGATAQEVARIRSFDRTCQGITPEQEAEAEQAIENREVDGRLTFVRMPHSKCATVTDRLHTAAGGAGYDQLLIVSGDGETNFFGDGALCALLKEKFDGWNGGNGLGQEGGNAYWGGYATQVEIEEFVRQQLS